MVKKINMLIMLVLALMGLNSCDIDTSEHSDSESVVNKADTLKNQILRLVPLEDSPEFPDAALELNSPDNGRQLKSGQASFSYEVKNYKLTEKTNEGTCALHCANSGKGQHIHLILNNKPYLAKYETEFSEELEDGHYVALSFLSRSYHESIKSYGAYDLRQFSVGNVPAKKIDLTQPMLFYSRPKGEYVGAIETQKVLLDFFLVNTSLSSAGNKVKVTINGQVFFISDWRGYAIEGLPMGESTISIELLDAEGKLINSPFNKTERKIVLKENKDA